MPAHRAAIVALAAAMVAFIPVAIAHGPEWEWIAKEPRYVDRHGIHCCSTDCFPVSASRFHEDGGGIIFDGNERLSLGDRGIYTSNEPNPPGEQRWWVCRRHNSLKCIFKPSAGS